MFFKKNNLIILFVAIFSFCVSANSSFALTCNDGGNLMQQGDGTADNNLSFVGFEFAGGLGEVRSFFKFTPTADMNINKIKVNLVDDSCFASGNEVDIYISLNNWAIVVADLEADGWTVSGPGVYTITLNSDVFLSAGTDYEINFVPKNVTGNAGLCKIATDTNGERTSSYIFPLASGDVCGVLPSCFCSTNISSAFSYYNRAINIGTTCAEVDPLFPSCTDYDNCGVSEPNSKLYNDNGFAFPVQKWEYYKDYPDIELICALPTFCGDNVVQSPNDAGIGGPANDGMEECDGSDNVSCGGFGCDPNCVCNSYCGDNLTQAPNGTGIGGPANDGVEECDGSDDAVCGGFGCNPFCVCNPDPSNCDPLFDNTGGIVPCGKITDNLSTPWNETESCKVCHVIILARNIINFLMEVVVLIAVLSIIIAGFVHIKSDSNSSLLLATKRHVNKIILGFAIVFTAWTITNVTMVLFGFEDPFGDGSWDKFDCNLNEVPSFCGDGIVNGLEVCDFNAPGTGGEIDCESLFFDGLPAYCSGIPISGTRKCNQCCSGWEDCTALPPVAVSSSSTACASTSPTLNGFACCELTGCGKDGCGCCGRASSVSMPGTYNTIQQMKPCGGVGGFNCKLGQSILTPTDWIVRTNHTTATYRCWN